MKDRFLKGAAWLTTAVTLVGSLLTAVPVVSATASFSDVNSGTSYYQAIVWAYDHGILQGYSNGSFGPDNCVRRAELAKMIVNYAHTGTAAVGSLGSDPGFTDVPSTAWFYPYVKEAKYMNYVQGYSDGSFRPNICVNRAEAMKIASNALLPSVGTDSSGSPMMYDNKLVTDVDIYAWYAPYVRVMFKNRLVGTDHTTYDAAVSSAAVYAIKFYPAGSMTRKEVAEMLYRISNFTGSNPTPTPTPGSTDVNITYQAPTQNYSTMPAQIMFQWSANVSDSTLVLEYRDPNNIGSIQKTARFTGANGYSKTLSLGDYQNDFSSYKTFCWKLEKTGTNYLSSSNGYPCVSYVPQTTTNVNITYQSPNTTYSSMPAQLDFQWSTSVSDATLVLEYRNQNTPSTVAKTVKYTSISGSSKTLYANDFQTDFTNYRTFCWKLEKAGTNFLSSTNGYPCVNFSPATLTAPGLVYPANGTSFYGSNPQLTVTWSPAQGASRYDLMVLFGGSSTYRVYSVNGSYNTNMSYYIPVSDFPALTQNYTHRWRVRAYDASNNYTESPEWTFNVYMNQQALAAPTLLSPSANAVLTNFPRDTYFQWSAVSGAANYQLELGCNLCNGGTNYSNPLSYSTTNTWMYQTMTGDNTFRFRVRAMSATGSPGTWSEYRYFSYST